MTLELFQQAGNDLYHRLHLPTYPVAIKYIKSENEIPAGVMRPKALGQKWSICQAQTYVRRFGWNTAMTADDNFCVPASAMHHWVDVSEDEFIESQVKQGWHKDRQAEKNRYDSALKLLSPAKGKNLLDKAREYCGFVASPLQRTIIEPDTVLVFGDGNHVLHLIHAICYDYKMPVSSSFEGFGESCMKGGLIPFLTGKAQVVLPGMGDRSFAGIAENELGIGFPAFLLDQILQDLFKTGGEMNIGLPAKTLMANGLTESITPGFTYLRGVVDRKKEG